MSDRDRRQVPGGSAGECWQADGGIIAQRGDGFQGQVAGTLDRPFIVLFDEDGADEPDDGGLIGEDADTSVLRLISPMTRSHTRPALWLGFLVRLVLHYCRNDRVPKVGLAQEFY